MFKAANVILVPQPIFNTESNKASKACKNLFFGSTFYLASWSAHLMKQYDWMMTTKTWATTEANLPEKFLRKVFKGWNTNLNGWNTSRAWTEYIGYSFRAQPLEQFDKHAYTTHRYLACISYQMVFIENDDEVISFFFTWSTFFRVVLNVSIVTSSTRKLALLFASMGMGNKSAKSRRRNISVSFHSSW